MPLSPQPGASAMLQRRLVLLSAALLLAVLAGQPHSAHAGFVRRDGKQLMIGNCPFYFAGANQYYLSYSSISMVRNFFDGAKQLGLTVVRMWAFLDQPKDGIVYQRFDSGSSKPVINGGPNGLQKLDAVIEEAGKRGIRLILTLTNNWGAFGGMDQYVEFFGGSHHEDFYLMPEIKSAYKAYVKSLVLRKNSRTGRVYRDDPTIMMWELANEARCSGTDHVRPINCDSDTIISWASEMSAFIKSLDSNHLVSMGDEGFFKKTPGQKHWAWTMGKWGCDAGGIARIPTIDVVTFHLYPGFGERAWGLTNDQALVYIRGHIQTAAAVNKPLIMEEYGVAEKSERRALYQQWQSMGQQAGMAGTLLWIVSGKQDDGSRYPDYDGYTLYASDSSTKTLLGSHAAAMRIRSSCKKANGAKLRGGEEETVYELTV